MEKKLKPGRGWILGMAGCAIAIGLIGLGISRLTAPSQTSQVKTDTPTPLPQPVEVVALGRLEPQGEMIRIGGSDGERIRRLEVKQGDSVRTGAVLAYLKSYEERLAERNYAASQLAEAKERLEAATSYAGTQIQEAQTRIQQINQPGTFEIEAQRATIRQLEAKLELVQEDIAAIAKFTRRGGYFSAVVGSASEPNPTLKHL